MLAVLQSLGMFIIDLFKSRRRLEAENLVPSPSIQHRLIGMRPRVFGYALRSLVQSCSLMNVSEVSLSARRRKRFRFRCAFQLARCAVSLHTAFGYFARSFRHE